MTHIYAVKRDPRTLALGEAEVIGLVKGSVVIPGIVVGSAAVTPASAAYLRHGAEVMASADSLEQLCECVRARGISSEGFRIVVERVPRRFGVDALTVARAIADCLRGGPDLKNPAEEFLVVASETGWWFGRMLAAGDRAWERLRDRPFHYCNALPIEIARAMINLTVEPGDTVFDPCCGSGTIVLMASEMGHKALGCDVNRNVAYRALQNVRHFEFAAAVWAEDATRTERRADCIVTNLAYGRQCPTTPENTRALLANFRRLASRVTVISSVDLAPLAEDLGYSVVSETRAATHTVTRRIYVMKSPK